MAVNGQNQQVYFDTEEQAHQYIDLMLKIDSTYLRPWQIKRKKRSTAKHQDLPVGFCDYEQNRKVGDKEYIYNILCCTFKHNGKVKRRSVQHGIQRTRQESIIILTERVLKTLNEE